jgi:hypothetical protein
MNACLYIKSPYPSRRLDTKLMNWASASGKINRFVTWLTLIRHRLKVACILYGTIEQWNKGFQRGVGPRPEALTLFTICFKEDACRYIESHH